MTAHVQSETGTSHRRPDARIPLGHHTSQPWRAHALLPDFEVEDVWKLPVTISADDDIALVRDRLFAALSNTLEGGISGFLFGVRLKLGSVFGWDGPEHNGGEVDPTPQPGSLRERYAEEERLSVDDLPALDPDEAFQPVFVLENESLDELSNATAHAGLHLGKVALDDDDDRFGVQLAIYVKPNGRPGRLYMAAIKPFRHHIVYPALMRNIADAFD